MFKVFSLAQRRLGLSFLLAVGAILVVFAWLSAPVQGAPRPTGHDATVAGAPARRPLADLEITQSGPIQTFPGETVSYTLVLVNNSGTAMTDLTLIDTWRTDILGKNVADLWDYGPLMTFEDYTISDPEAVTSFTHTLNRTLQRGEAIWTIGTLGAGASLEIIFTATVPITVQPTLANYPLGPLPSKFRALGPSTIQNSVSALVGGAEYAANLSTATIFGPLLNLTLSVWGETVDANAGRVGRLITYTIAVKNTETTVRTDSWPATNLVVSSAIPLQLVGNLVGVTASAPEASATYTEGSTFILWRFGPTYVMTPGFTTYLTYTARIPANLDYNNATERTLKILAYEGLLARADLMPLRPASTKSSSSVRVWGPLEKVGVTSTGKNSTLVNKPITYTLSFYNPIGTAAPVTLSDTFHETFLFSHVATSTGGVFSTPVVTQNVATWANIPLNGYDVVSVTFVVTPTPATLAGLACNKSLAATNAVFATSPAFPVSQYIGDNNNKLASITVLPQVKIVKSAGPTSQFPGERVEYIIKLTNEDTIPIPGPSVVTDTLPTVFRFITMTSEAPPGIPTVLSDTILTWHDVPSIPAKSNLHLSFWAEVDGEINQSYANKVEVNIPGVTQCVIERTASVKVLTPFNIYKVAHVPALVVQGDPVTYSAAIANLSPRTTYTTVKFVDMLDTAKTGLVNPITLGETYEYTLPAPLPLLPGSEPYSHTFTTTLQGKGISYGTDHTWCDATFANKRNAIISQAARKVWFIGDTGWWVGNANSQGSFNALPHISLYQQAYPNPVAIGEVVTFVLTLRDNRTNPSLLAEDVMLLWSIPTDFEFLWSDPVTTSQTGTGVLWTIPAVPSDEDVRIIFRVRAVYHREIDWRRNFGPLTQVVALNDPALCIPKTSYLAYSLSGADAPENGIPGPLPDSNDIGFTSLQVNQGIEITKKPTPAEIGPYGTVAYELSVANLTGAPVTGIVITDVLPSYEGGTLAWEYLETIEGIEPHRENPLAWYIGGIAPQSTLQMIFTVRANNWLGLALNEITGTAPINLIHAKRYETDRQVIVSTGIGFYKAVTPEAVAAGEAVTYTIRLFNGEDYDLGSVVITDTLPAGFVFEAMVSPAVLPEGTTTLVWHLPTKVAKGATYDLVFRARTNTAAEGMFTGVYYNDLVATGNNLKQTPPSPVLIPPTGPTAPVHVTGQPAVEVEKEASLRETLPGADLVYTITLYNQATVARILQVTDTLPVDFTLLEALSPTEILTTACGEQQCLLWQDLNIGPQENLTLTFRAHIAVTALDMDYYNQVQVQIDEFPMPPLPKLARVKVTIPPTVDAQVASSNHQLVVEKFPEPIIYTIHYTNAAASEANLLSIRLVETFSPTAYLNFPTDAGWTALPTGQYQKIITGPFAPGDAGTEQLVVSLQEDTPAEVKTLYNRVDIYYTTETLVKETVLQNNYSEETDLVSGGEAILLMKEASAHALQAGEEVTYTLTLFNNNAVLSYSVQLSDTLPYSFTWVAPVGATPAPTLVDDSGNILWENVVMQPLELQQFVFRARVDMLVAGGPAYCNVAQAQWQEEGEPQTPVSAIACVSVTPAAKVDVSVEKSNHEDYVTLGQTLVYNIAYHNAASSETPVQTIILTETVAPFAAVEYAGWLTTQGTATTLGDGRYRLELPIALAPGESDDVSFMVILKTAITTDTQTLNNQVEIGFGADRTAIEINPANNLDTDVDPIQHNPQDVMATKSATPEQVTANQQVDYVITLYNESGNPYLLRVIDTLPAGMIFSQAVFPTVNYTTTWIGDRQQIAWSDIPIQTAASIWFRARVAPDLGAAELCNTVQVRRGNVLQTEVSGLACVAVSPMQTVDTQVTKTDGVALATGGQILTYTIAYTNAADSETALDTVLLTEAITPTDAIAEVLSAEWFAMGGGMYRYTRPIPLAAGESDAVTFRVRLADTVAVGTQLVNTVLMSYTTAAPVREINPADNQAQDVDILAPAGSGEVIVTKSVTPEAVSPGGDVAYTIQIFNTGTTAHTVRVTDTLPISFTLATGAPDATGVSGGRQQLIWHSVPVPAAGQTQIAFTARVAAAAAAGMYDNYVQALPTGGAPADYEGARVTVSTLVQPQVDVQVTHSDGVTRFGAGDRLTYTVQYASVATSEVTLTQVMLTETIAPAANVTLVNIADWTALGGGRYTRLIGELAPGASGNIPFIVQVSGEPPAITNTVEIGYPAQGVQETQTANNRATDVNTLKGGTPTVPIVYLPLIIRQ